MLYLLSKAVEPMLWPFNLALILLVVALLRRRRKPISRLTVAALGILLLFSIPVLSSSLRYHWENHYPSRHFSEYPARDVIVVLGGTVAQTRYPRLQPEETSGARVFTAWRLYRAGKAPLMLCSGGIPYLDIHGEERTEADDMCDLLIEMGVPADRVLRERKSRSTYENARFSYQILGPRGKTHILLSTTAMHQMRAAALFRKAGFDVTPVPNTWYTSPEFHWSDFLPDLITLFGNTHWLKEVIGLAFFKAVGKA